MRLICPNCGAQYEVPDEVIPASGRDVQCSNCGDTWFQPHADMTPASTDEDRFNPAKPAAQDTADDATSPSEPEPEQEIETEPAAHPAASDTPRRGIDPDVAEILRSEAEREREVRAATASNLETQPDLGLDDPAVRSDEHSRQIRTRMDRLRGETGLHEADDPVSSDNDIDPKSRRNLFPDIEEINSTLNAEENRTYPDLAALPQRAETDQKSGFGRGFRATVLVFVIAALIYVLAPRISALIPAAEAPLAQYVESVNVARLWLDQSVSRALVWISGVTGQG